MKDIKDIIEDTRKKVEALLGMDYVTKTGKKFTFSRSVTEEEITELYKEILHSKILKKNALTNSALTKNFCISQLANLDEENFGAIFLNQQNDVIAFKILFTGTVNAAAIYPRTIVKLALKYNASGLIVSHNHPGGDYNFSRQDIQLTKELKKLLTQLDIDLLDHILVADGQALSMKETYNF